MYKYLIPVFCLIIFSSCNQSMQHVSDMDVEYMRTTDDIKDSSTAIEDMISPYRNQMDSEMNTVLGTLPVNLKKDRPNSNLGNWFCDGLFAMAQKKSKNKIAFAIQNYGGFRVSFLSKGPLTRGKVFELMPFDNKLVILKLDAKVMKTLLDQMVNDGGWPISQQLSFKMDDGKATEVMINGKPLNTNKEYYVAMPDYVANGGGDCFFLKSIPQEDTGLFIRDAIIDHLIDLKDKGETLLTVDENKRIF